MYKIAVLGDRDSIYGFAGVGLDPYPVSDPAKALEILKYLVKKDYAIIYITEALEEELKSELNHFSADFLPAIILIPGVSGNTGEGMKKVKRSVERAVGTDIIFG